MFKPIVLRNWQGSLMHISNARKALVMKWMIGKQILWQIVPDISEPRVLRKSVKSYLIHPRGFWKARPWLQHLTNEGNFTCIPQGELSQHRNLVCDHWSLHPPASWQESFYFYSYWCTYCSHVSHKGNRYSHTNLHHKREAEVNILCLCSAAKKTCSVQQIGIVHACCINTLRVFKAQFSDFTLQMWSYSSMSCTLCNSLWDITCAAQQTSFLSELAWCTIYIRVWGWSIDLQLWIDLIHAWPHTLSCYWNQ